jgi:hypothetical protein
MNSSFTLRKFESIMTSYNSPYSLAFGDFNANINKSGADSHAFGTSLLKYCTEENLTLSDIEHLPRGSYTFLSEAHGTTSWIDHLVSTKSAHSLIQSMNIKYDFISSDHHPIALNISMGNISLQSSGESACRDDGSIKWDKLKQDDILQYKMRTDKELSKVKLEHELILCDDPHCNNTSHHNAIDRMYKATNDALLEASAQLLTKPKYGYYQVQGWNTYCKEVHELARDAYLLWRDHGKQRQGFLFNNMKRTRAQFKRSLRQCRQDTSRISADLLANNLLQKDDRGFWKEIRKVNNSGTPLASTVNDVTGGHAITNMWQEHFKQLLNSSEDTTSKSFVCNALADKDGYTFSRFTPSNVIDGICSLKKGKSAGRDNIYSEHFILAHDKAAILLSMLFNAMVVHGHMPQMMMDTVLIPIIKDKKGDVTDRDNYRPVAVACIISKILELILLDRYGEYLQSSHNQFGFKAKLGTDMCVYTLKQVVDYYRSLSSPVYVAYMDASKAFDKINHFHLMAKLIKANLPLIIVRLLYFWCRNQFFMVRWGGFISKPFCVTNGVRQGGIMSPICFNVYLNQLSQILNDCHSGCIINSCRINHLLYADDSVLLGPTPKSLQKLIDLCEDYASKYELSFNIKKTKVMCFKPKELADIYVPDFTLNGNKIDLVSSHTYLGVIIDDSSRDNDDLFRQTKAIYARGNILVKKFSSCNVDVKARLYKAYCSSFYCSQLWSSFSTASFRKLQSSYNRMFRNLFKLERDCSISQKCLEYNVDSLKVLLRKSAYSFRCRILQCDNILIQGLNKSNFFVSCSLTKRWNNLLFKLSS